MEEKLKTAEEEKFRPGGGTLKQKGNFSKAISGNSSRTSPLRLPTARRNTDDRFCSINVDTSATAEILAAYEVRDGETTTEWAELHPNGTTTICGHAGGGGGQRRSLRIQSGGDPNEIVLPNRPSRYSTGAATHLSRITEGTEDGEGEGTEEKRKSKGNRRSTFKWGKGGHDSMTPRLRQIQEGRQHDTIEMADVQTKKTWSITNVNPFADDAIDVNSVYTGLSARDRQGLGESADRPDSSIDPFQIGKRWTDMSLEVPSPVHRPQGAPLITLPSCDNACSQNSPHTPMRPLISSPLSALASSPALPAPKAANWGAVQAALLRKGEESSNTAAAAASDEEHLQMTGRGREFSQTSELLRKEKEESSYDLPDEQHSLRRRESGPRLDALNPPNFVDESDQDVSNRLSAVTTSSVGSMGYLMMSPRIVTPADKGGIQRLQLKQGKAQLVRVNSEKSSASGNKKSLGAASEIRGKHIASQSISLLDFAPDEKSKRSDEDPFLEEKNENGDGTMEAGGVGAAEGDESQNDRRYSTIGEGSSLDPIMPSMGTNVARPPSTISNSSSFGLPPFANTPTDDIGSFYQRCTSEASHYDGNSSNFRHLSNGTFRTATMRHSNGTITGLSVLDDVPFQLRTNGDGEDDKADQEEPTEAVKTHVEQGRDTIKAHLNNRF